MKRKIKLFSAIASLCLAVALMAFGVYAASQVTYTLKGTVEYTVNNALVKVTGQYQTVSTLKGYTEETVKTESNWGELTQLTNGVDATGDYTNSVKAGEDTLDVNFADTSAVKVELTVQNIMQEYKATIAVEITPATQNGNFKVIQDGNVTEVGANDSEVLTFYIFIENVAKDVESTSYSIKLTIGQGAKVTV